MTSPGPDELIVTDDVLAASVAALKNDILGGAGAEYDTLGKLVAALIAGELGGSTDAAELAGALTSAVDANGAIIDVDFSEVGGPEMQMPLASLGPYLVMIMQNQSALEGKADTDHQHPVADLTMTGTASSTTFARGDGMWATPPDTNTTYAVPTQAEAEAGTATTARAFSAQRVAQGAIAASGKKDWQGTQAQYDALGTKEADRTYWIV